MTADGAPASEWEDAMIMLVGPIKYWWGREPRRFGSGTRPIWNTPDHLIYVGWRDYMWRHLQKRTGYTSYRADLGIKGPWDERFQVVNDAFLAVCSAMLNLCPPGVPSEGTNGELQQAAGLEKPVVAAPPPGVPRLHVWVPRFVRALIWRRAFAQAAAEAVSSLDQLKLFRPAVMQADVIYTLPVTSRSEYAIPALVRHYRGHPLRVHYRTDWGVEAVTTRDIMVGSDGVLIMGTAIAFDRISKIEVLAA